MADIDPHDYDIFRTRHGQYPSKLSRSGQKWSMKLGARSAPVSPKDTSDFDTDEGQHFTQQVLQVALDHERRQGRRNEGLYRTRSSWDIYEESLPDVPILPSPFETKTSQLEKEPEATNKVMDITSRAEMTMPRSPVMGEPVDRKSPPQIERESLVSTMAKEIQQEKEREKQSPLPIERTIVQPEIDFDKRCEEASKIEQESINWPPLIVYGITPQTSLTEEASKQYRDTPPVIDYYGYRPKVTELPAIMTNTIQGTSAFMVPTKG